jgi:catechol 2,3-dioxygenase-like lactoylglutathione lyase family enzyme
MRAKIFFITLAVDDLGQSVAFYRDGLGWPTEGIVGQEFHDEATGADGTIAFFTLDTGPVARKPRSVSLVADAPLDEIVVEWVLAAVGGDRLVSVTGLREGGPPWLMRYEGFGGAGSVVLRVGAPETAGTQKFEVCGIELASARGVPAPGVIAARATQHCATGSRPPVMCSPAGSARRNIPPSRSPTGTPSRR